MKLLLKRDDATTANPAADQLSVGELVVNSVTGKLFTKLTDGTVVEFIGQRVCNPNIIPTILFSDTFNFCCYGDILYVTVSGLQAEPREYTFEFDELTGNSTTSSVGTPNYTNYTSTEGAPPGQIVNLRSANIPVNITIDNPDNINIFKFSILSNNVNITEKTVALNCSVCP